MRCEGEGFGSSPAEASDGELPIGCGQFFTVFGCGIEIGENLSGVESGDGLDAIVLCGERIGASAVLAMSAEHVWRDDDEAFCGDFIGHLFCPVAETEDLVNENDDGGFALCLWIDDKCLHGAIVDLERHVFAMARGGLQSGFGPVLRMSTNWGEEEGEKECSGHGDSAGKAKVHGEKCSWEIRA